MSYLAKLNEAKAILAAHAQASGQEKEANPDHLISIIQKALGGTSEESLAELVAEDFEKIGLPVGIARRLVKVFEGGEKETRQVVVIDNDPTTMALRLKPSELVAEYDPNEADNAFGARLKVISGNNPFIVFNNDGSVNEGISSRLLQELRDNYPPRKTVIDRGTPYQTYKVGDRPARFADENPVMHGVMLRPDGYSDTNFRWGSIDFKVRQLIYLAVLSKEIAVNERLVFSEVEGRSFEELAQRYPLAFLKFGELEGCKTLPQMKMQLKLPEPPATK